MIPVSTLIDVHPVLENHENLTVDTIIIYVKEVYYGWHVFFAFTYYITTKMKILSGKNLGL